MPDRPKASVIIPTYNRQDLLRVTLHHLTRQTLPAEDFEVIVADDGSSDETEQVARSFADRLRIKYHYQEDRGFRAGAARNAGARLAEAPVLVFFDTGIIPGRDCLSEHVAAHAGDTARRAVLGYAYGYNPVFPPDLREALETMSPEEVQDRFRRNPGFLDIRHVEMAACGFDLTRRAAPWTLFFSMNCSVRSDDFWQAGGFEEGFSIWSMEDIALGFRLAKNGVPLHVSMDAWVIESPHERSDVAQWKGMQQNIVTFLEMHPEPSVEIGWGLIMGERYMEWETEYQAVLEWARTIQDLDVSGEIDEAVRRLPSSARAHGRIAVMGAGGAVPPSLPPSSVVMDVDERLLAQAVAAGRHEGHHALGLRTLLADQAVDTVLITSRLAGPWARWEAELLAEARRIGREVYATGDFAGGLPRL